MISINEVPVLNRALEILKAEEEAQEIDRKQDDIEEFEWEF